MADTSVITLPRDPSRAAVNRGAGLWSSSLLVAGRMVRKFARTPQLIVFTTAYHIFAGKRLCFREALGR